MAEKRVDKYLLKQTEEFDLGLHSEEVKDLGLDLATEIEKEYIQGRVVDQDDNIIPGATVKLFNSNFEPLIHTVTGEDGMFRFDNYPAEANQVVAVADNYKLVVVPMANIVKDGYINDVILYYTFDNNELYYGKVKDTDGNPVANIGIDLIQNGLIQYSTTTADDGEFLFYNVRQGQYSLEGYNPSYRIDLTDNIVIDGTEQPEVTLQARSINNVEINGTINGEIIDAYGLHDLQGAFVALYLIEDGVETIVQTTLTDMYGRYMFGNVPEGRYVVKARVDQAAQNE